MRTMTPDDDQGLNSNEKQRSISKPQHWFSTPKPVKRLFDRFPLVTYPANELPERTALARKKNRLYIFEHDEGARYGRPSFNPSCLKWQTYLKFAGIEFETINSNNHASPTGSLPFLLPASLVSDSGLENVAPIPSHKLQQWASKQQAAPSKATKNMRYTAYMALIEHSIRNAWLYTLYLNPFNFDKVARPAYITPLTSSSPVRIALSHHLRSAARDELLKHSPAPIVDIQALFQESDRAFSALSELLGDDHWFFGERLPSFFDAAVFAYTHLLLEEAMGWDMNDERLGQNLRDGKWPNLSEHRERIRKKYYL